MRKLIALLLLMTCPLRAQFPVVGSDIVDFKFTTRDATGLPTTLSGSPAVACYKGNSTTQTTTGVTLSANFDSVTGLNNLRVDTSQDTSFYAVGSYVSCVISAGTVDSISVVGEVVASFYVGNSLTVRKGVAFSNYPVWMLASNGNGITGITVTCLIQKDGGAWAATTNNPSEIGRGKYGINLTATELSANIIALECTPSGGGASRYRTNLTPQQ